MTSATCYLPLSDNLSISKDLGTRHRAALGISESTDSLTVVVSEETGRVSLAEGGSLRRINSPEELKLAIAAKPEEETVSGPFKLLKGWHKNEEKQRIDDGDLLISFAVCLFSLAGGRQCGGSGHDGYCGGAGRDH